MFPRDREHGTSTTSRGRHGLCCAARATVLIVGVAGGLTADSDTLLAGAAHQIRPLVLALEPAEGAQRRNVLIARVGQIALGLAGGALVMRVIASATHGLFHANRPDMTLILYLSIATMAIAIVAELAAGPFGSRADKWHVLGGVLVAMVPAAAASIALRSTLPVDAIVGLVLLALVPVRWMSRTS